MSPQPVRKIEDFRALGVPHNRRGSAVLFMRFIALYVGMIVVATLLIVFAPLIAQALRALFS